MTFRPKAKANIASISATSKAKEKSVKPAVLQILLEHGDIMVMHGRKIQQFYEVSQQCLSVLFKHGVWADIQKHAVTPMGALRFALTCRYIRPELMADEAETQNAILKGTLPPGSEKYNYDGDMNAVPRVSPANEVNKVVNNVTAKLKTGDLTVSELREINERLARFIKSSNTEPERALEAASHSAILDAA